MSDLPRLTLEADIGPDVVARLTRHPAVTAKRVARSRSTTEEILWLDTPKGELGDAGLLLEAPARRPRRLFRILPPAETPWCPGQPPEVLRETGPEDALPEAGGAALMPLAEFSGRRSVLALATEAGRIEAILVTGRLRCSLAERKVARLVLSGGAGAVLDVIRTLSQDFPLLPPRAALAEEARALAHGEVVRPRQRGAPDLSGAGTVEEALGTAIGRLLEAMLYQAPHALADAGPEGVHQMRVALRRLRSVLRVFRKAADGPAPRSLDGGLKDLLGLLGPARDWDVFRDGIGAEVAAAFPEDDRIAALRRSAEMQRQAAYADLRRCLEGPGFRRLVWDGVALVAERGWRRGASEKALGRLDAPLESFARDVLEKRWQRLLEVGAGIETLRAEALHGLRLDAKRLRYAVELFAPLWPGKASRRLHRRLVDLQDALGRANDAAVASGLVRSLEGNGSEHVWAVGVFEGWARASVSPMRDLAEKAWFRLSKKSPFWIKA